VTPSGLRDERDQGFWRFCLVWLKPAAAAVPWITVGLLLIMLHMISGAMTSAQGVMFDLPASGVADGEPTPLVALVMPMRNMGETYVFFDDARYTLGNEVSVSAFSSHLSERAAKTEGKTLLVLADKSVTCDQLMQMATVARKCGLQRILFANKRAEGRSE